MRKLFITIMASLSILSAQAITLFPHFVDVAGDFEEGTPEKFHALNIPVDHWRVSPSFFKTLSEADSFLKDTLPFSSYTIGRETKTLEDGTQIVKYTSSLEADGLYKDRWSTLYLLQTPGEPLYVGITEDKIN